MAFLSQRSVYDEGPEFLRDVWALAGVAILIFVLRIVAKFRIRKLGLDDFLMGCALCLALVGCALITVGVHYGFGQKVGDLSEEAASKVIMFDYLAQTFGLAAGAFGRISFIVFILGLLTSRLWQQVVLWILVALQITVNAVFIVILFVQCPGHQSAIWQHSDKEKCWSTHVQADYGYVQGGFNAATDLYLALFSTVIFWRLNLKVRVKLGLVALLGLGLFAMAAAIIKTVQTRILATPDTDPTIATVNYDRWLFIETYLVIITASIPNIRSLLKSRKSKGSTQHTHELSSRYASGSRHSGRIRGRVSSIDGKRMVNADETASDDETWRRDEHDSTYESQCSRESVIICV